MGVGDRKFHPKDLRSKFLMLGESFDILVQCAIKPYLCHSLINLYAEISSGAWCQIFRLNHYLIPNFMCMRKLGRMCLWVGSTEPSLLAYALTFSCQ